MKRASLFLLAFLIVMLFLSLYQIPQVKATPVLIDSYSEENRNSRFWHKDLHPSDSSDISSAFQSFQNLAGVYELTSCKFFLIKVGSPTGNGHAVLYAHSGTYGSSSVPTGSALGTSGDFDVSTLTTGFTLETFTFNGVEKYQMQASTYYCIVFENPTSGTIDADNYVGWGLDSTTPTHDGNSGYFANGAWVAAGSYDGCFYVYGEATIFEDGFESGDFSAWDGIVNDPVVDSNQVHHGTYSAEFNMSFQFCYKDSGLDESFIYDRFYVRMTELPDATNELIVFNLGRAGTNGIFDVGLHYQGTPKLRWYFHYRAGATWTSVYSPDDQTVLVDTWYCIEHYWKLGATDGESTLWVDGEHKCNVTDADTDDYGNLDNHRTGAYQVNLGGDPFTLFIDCYVDDDERINCEEEVGEFTEEFTNTTGISASLSLWKALYEKYSETITVSATSYGWKEKASFYTETTTITEQLNEWIELRRFFTESIVVTEASNFAMELLLEITEFAETITVDASLFLWKAKQFITQETISPVANFYDWIELKMTMIEFSELIELAATMYLTLPIIPPGEVEVTTFGTLALVIGIIALAIAVTAFAAKTKD